MNRPLLDIAEGCDQDQRNDLLAAFRAIVGRHHKRERTDLHVRELLTYALKFDHDGRGVQLSYDDIANLLVCERSTARKVVERAEKVFGLLAPIAQHRKDGSQAPNCYAIDWEGVRAALSPQMPPRHLMLDAPAFKQPPSPPEELTGNAPTYETPTATPATQDTPVGGPTGVTRAQGGVTTAHPPVTRAQGGVTTAHPPVTRAQGGVTTAHPYKDNTLSLSLSLSAAAKAAAANFADFDSDRWGEVARRAHLLARALQKMRLSNDIPREYVWEVCAGAELLERGLAATWVTRVDAGEIAKPRSFLDACMRDECQRRGLDWPELRSLIPRPPAAQKR